MIPMKCIDSKCKVPEEVTRLEWVRVSEITGKIKFTNQSQLYIDMLKQSISFRFQNYDNKREIIDWNAA